MRFIQNNGILLKTECHRHEEEGQSSVEFALILPILVVLMFLPVDLYRYISLQSQLNSAAVDGLSCVQYENIRRGNCRDVIIHAIDAQYGKKINVDHLTFDKLETSGATKERYTYYVYSSDKTGATYQDHFDAREANYQHCTITAQISLQLEPITFWGKMMMGDHCNVTSKEVSREVYSGGYVSGP